MNLDHPAIWKAYEGTVSKIDDSIGAFDKDGNKIDLDQSKIDAARVELDKLQYRFDRVAGATKYSSIGEQLDLLWHAIDADSDLKSKFSAFYNSIKAVKDANPKP
tara:strand:+ start:463 stop:777 length:315 start_codon:yes stop_codon:yes gene_type:complete